MQSVSQGITDHCSRRPKIQDPRYCKHCCSSSTPLKAPRLRVWHHSQQLRSYFDFETIQDNYVIQSCAVCIIKQSNPVNLCSARQSGAVSPTQWCNRLCSCAVQPASMGLVCSQQVQWTVLCTWYAASTSVRISRSHCNSHRSAAHMSRGCSAVSNAGQGQHQLKPTPRQYNAIILQDSHMQSVPQGSMVTLKHCIVMKAIRVMDQPHLSMLQRANQRTVTSSQLHKAVRAVNPLRQPCAASPTRQDIMLMKRCTFIKAQKY